MKKISAILFSISFILLFSGCSWMSEVYIFNRSNQPVVVRISFDSLHANEFSAPLTAFHIESWENDRVSLGDSVKIYRRSETGNVSYAELPAHTALRIGELLNQDMRSEADRAEFANALRILEVLSPNDAALKCNGNACLPKLIGINRGMAGFVIE